MIILPIPTTSLAHFSLKGWENVSFELGSERVNGVDFPLQGPGRAGDSDGANLQRQRNENQEGEEETGRWVYGA